MARGWESKAVESQIEEVHREEMDRGEGERPTGQQQQRLASLKLSRSRVLQQLERARHASHRQILLNGLQALEREIDAIANQTEPTSKTPSSSTPLN